MAAPPTVIYPLTLPALLIHVLTTQSSTVPTTLIICASREAFLQGLLRSLQLQNEQEGEGLQQLISPTLHNLFTARHVKITFCASVQTLLAYLAAYDGAAAKQQEIGEGRATERIVLVNPLSLHAPTPSFSAQGLSRTFAAAVEMALRVKATLVVAECQNEWRAANQHLEDEDTAMDNREGESHGEIEQNSWEQQVSILNVSAKRFGSGGADRAWAGRTVKAKRIAGKWFRFRKIEALQERERPG